jgi:hypothetical protein
MFGVSTRTVVPKSNALFRPVNLSSPAADLSQYLDSPAVSTVQTPVNHVFNVKDSLDSLVSQTYIASQLGKVFPTSGKPSAGATTAQTKNPASTWAWVGIAALVAFVAFRSL